MTFEVKHLSFGYKDRDILHNLTFTAQPQDLLCVLGPNGVGKSTLFRCMLGLITNYHGEISIAGENVRKMKPVELAKNIAYIPQSHHPTFNFTVLNMVLMGRTVHLGKTGNPKAEDERKAWQALDLLGISHLGHRGYAEISGGERQLALIARAIVQRAKVLVMDEPTANLDYGNQMRVMRQVKELATQGYTIILSTHNPEHAFLYGNKALVMFQGKMIAFGDPKEILTEALLQYIYGVSVKLVDIDTEDGKSRLIVPCLNQKENGHVYLD
ncbi:ABC transporter ATP-binding protein [Bacillus sp. REN10]|uniref:ABC transporter ATP-binding protein n=1 Tax=Bacillus sp. REN10 TaxID=2782541 RepID=UPI00193C77D0|nr:ABC transporter ATP-binding protein [Bacillus sp. REN10]